MNHEPRPFNPIAFTLLVATLAAFVIACLHYKP